MGDGWWDDFSNNLATDLAPFIALFGESPTKQYLSECLTATDKVIFAIAPLGVITAIVSAIRVCGTPSLRAFIGRAQEGAGTAEAELCSSTSRDVCELYSNGGIARVFGRPKLLEIVHDPKASHDAFYPPHGTKTTAGIYSFEKYIKTERGGKEWILKQVHSERKKQSSNTRESGVDEQRPPHFAPNPNLSLNIGIKPLERVWFIVAAIAGVIMQSFVLVWAGLSRYHFRWVRNSREDEYAVPLTIIGTAFLCLGMALCAHLIESRTKERVYERVTPIDSTGRSRMYWVQPGNQSIGDQIFDSFGYSDERSSLKTYITSWKDTSGNSSTMIWIWTAVVTTGIGFICQFLGLRACHSSVAIVQLGVTIIMSLIRVGLRAQRLRKEDNFMAYDSDFFQGHELDCLALKIGLPYVTNKLKGSDSTKRWPRCVWNVFSPISNNDTETSSRIPLRSSVSMYIQDEHSSTILEKLHVTEGKKSMLSGFRIKIGPTAGTPPDDAKAELQNAAKKVLNRWISTEYRMECRNECLCGDNVCKRDPNVVAKTFFYRSRLARMTGLTEPESDHSSYWSERFILVRETAVKLAQAIEDTMEILFTSDPRKPVKFYGTWGQAFSIFWTVQCSLLDSVNQEREESAINMSLRRDVDHRGIPEGLWKADTSEIEAVLGLWLWSLKQPRKRQDDGMGPNGMDQRIARILSAHRSPEDASRGMQELHLWRGRDSVKVQQRQLKVKPTVSRMRPGSTCEISGTRHSDDQGFGWERTINCAKIQNGVWWKENEEFVTNKEGPPRDSRDQRRLFGWNNIRETSEYSETIILDITSKKSLLVNCAQDLYSIFLTSIIQAVEDIGGQIKTKRYRESFIVNNENVDKIQSALITRGLCDEEDAFGCTIPILRNQSKLPFAHELLSMAADIAEEYHREKKWDDVKQLINWTLRRSYAELELRREQNESTRLMKATNNLRISLLNACEAYRQALLQDDNEGDIVGCDGIIGFLRQYSQDEKIVQIPLTWVDCGTVPTYPSSNDRRFSLADAIRCYGEAALRYIRSKEPLSTHARQRLMELEGYSSHEQDAGGLFQSILRSDLSSTLFYLQRHSLHEPQRTQALILASQKGWFMVAKTLVELGAQIDQEDNNERTALSYASELGDINTVSMLFDKGAAVRNREPHDYEQRRTACHYAAKQGHAVITKCMRKRLGGSSSIDKEDHEGMTPLSWAITSGNADTVRALLSNASWVDLNHYHTMKPALHLAIEKGREEIVGVLLQHKNVDPNHNNGRTIDSPPLVHAIRLQRESIFEMVLNESRTHADQPDQQKRTALWWAAALGFDSYVQKLLSSGKVHFPDKTDSHGDTPLSIAAKAGHIGVVRQLRNVQGTSVGLKSIVVAAKNGHVAVVEELLPSLVKDKNQARRLLEHYGLGELWLSIQNSNIWENVCEGAIGSDSDNIEVGELTQWDIEYASKLAKERVRRLSIHSR